MQTVLQPQAIGIIDSGSGGLSLLKQLHCELPTENLIYLADTKHIPYGALSTGEIQERVLALSNLLLQKGVKAIVLACNTATAHGIDRLRAEIDLPIFGVEPPIKPAALASKNKVLGVLATAATVNSERFKRLVSGVEGRVVVQSCPGLADAIEYQSSELPELLERYLSPIMEEKADVLALGCTHYELVKEEVQNIVGVNVMIFEPSSGTLRRLAGRLEELNLLRLKGGKSGEVAFYSTGDLGIFKESMSRWFNPSRPILSAPV